MDEKIKKELLDIKDCYAEDTRHFLRFLSNRNLDIDSGGLRAYVEFLKGAGYTAGTVNKRLQGAKNRIRLIFRKSPEALNTLSRFQMETVLKEIKGLKRNTRAVDVEKTLTLGEIRRLIRAKSSPGRVKLFIEFLVSTGVRVSEMTGINIKDLKFESKYVSIRIVGKGNKERFLKVKQDLVRRTNELFSGKIYLFETRDHRRYLRQYVSDSISLAGKTVLKKNISAHTLRHTFATIQIQKNRKIKALSIYLGHASTSITQDMYVHEELDLDDLDLRL